VKHVKTAVPVKRLTYFTGEAIMYWLSEPVIVDYLGQKERETSYVVVSGVDLRKWYGEPHYELAIFDCLPDGTPLNVIQSMMHVFPSKVEHWVPLSMAGYVIV